jgi:hypothetical protein
MSISPQSSWSKEKPRVWEGRWVEISDWVAEKKAFDASGTNSKSIVLNKILDVGFQVLTAVTKEFCLLEYNAV